MQRTLTLIGLATIWTALAFGETFSGQLVDASCTASKQQDQAACAPTSSTTVFAVNSGGKIYKLDNSGNSKAVDALKNRADRSTNPNSMQTAPVIVKITGTADGDTLKVDTLEVQ